MPPVSPKADDPVFRAHWLGIPDGTAVREPRNAFMVPKMACADPRHASCGDCLRELWFHDKIGASRHNKCGVCRAMGLTIAMRRRPNETESEFKEFDAWMRANIDYVCRAVDARHLISFITNYATHGSGAERAGAPVALWMNMVEKISTSTPVRGTVIPKVEGWVVSDGRFVKEGTFVDPSTNFTMYNWNGGDAITNTVALIRGALRDAPLIARMTMAILGWAIMYDVTNPGIMRKFSRDRSWIPEVISAYWEKT